MEEMNGLIAGHPWVSYHGIDNIWEFLAFLVGFLVPLFVLAMIYSRLSRNSTTTQEYAEPIYAEMDVLGQIKPHIDSRPKQVMPAGSKKSIGVIAIVILLVLFLLLSDNPLGLSRF